jgi:hypothetical protein
MAFSNADVPTPVPFPHPESPGHNSSSNHPHSPSLQQNKRSRTSTNASTTTVGNRIRTASLKLIEADAPLGFMAATGSVTSKAPSLAEIRRGSYGSEGWNDDPQRYDARRRASQSDESRVEQDSARRPGMAKGMRSTSSSDRLKAMGVEPFPALTEEEMGAYPPRETRVEGDLPQLPSYDDPEKDGFNDGKIRGNVHETDGERPQPVDRQVSIFPHGPGTTTNMDGSTRTVTSLRRNFHGRRRRSLHSRHSGNGSLRPQAS